MQYGLACPKCRGDGHIEVDTSGEELPYDVQEPRGSRTFKACPCRDEAVDALMETGHSLTCAVRQAYDLTACTCRLGREV